MGGVSIPSFSSHSFWIRKGRGSGAEECGRESGGLEYKKKPGRHMCLVGNAEASRKLSRIARAVGGHYPLPPPSTTNYIE